MPNKWLIGIFFGLSILVFIKRKEILEYSQKAVWDLFTEARIMTLHPMIRDAARAFINKADEQGIKLRVTSAYRTHEQQEALYQQGRTKPGNIVTNAKPGQSFHNFGLAIDVVPIVNGVADWNTDWSKIAAIGKSVGFEWGGDWISFKDKPHFQMSLGNTLAQLQSMYNSGLLNNGYVQLA